MTAILTPLETATGLVPGEDATSPRLPPPDPAGALPALEGAILAALRRSPCLVAFSGGRDSSAVLALATRLAEREGLRRPIPITVRFPGAAEADESAWQERVIRALAVDHWERLDGGDELGALGATAREILDRHGLLWPPNVHTLVPLLEAASGGSLLTGIGGDEVFRRTPTRRRRLVAALRRRRASPPRLEWLTGEAQDALDAALAAEGASQPAPPPAYLGWLARRRNLAVLQASAARLAAEAGATAHHPLLVPAFLATLAADGSPPRMRAVLGDLMPAAVLDRPDKATFTRALWGPDARRFAGEWTGDGFPDELIDAEALRRVWLPSVPDYRSATPLQAAWLAERQTATRSDDPAERVVPALA
jgi:asparagine synthase